MSSICLFTLSRILLILMITIYPVKTQQCQDYSQPLSQWSFNPTSVATSLFDEKLGLPAGIIILYQIGSQRSSVSSTTVDLPIGSNKIAIEINYRLNNNIAFWIILQFDNINKQIDSSELVPGETGWTEVQRNFSASPGSHTIILEIHSPGNVDRDWIAIEGVTATVCPDSSTSDNFKPPPLAIVILLSLVLAVLIVTGVYIVRRYYLRARNGDLDLDLELEYVS